MKLLLSNDDGVYAEGLAALAAELGQNFEIAVVAPERDHSGASNSLTLNRPLILQKGTNGFSWVDGTPTDAVHLGLSRIFDFSADRVVSGINSHANLGDDVLYSGTVAAAMEGRFLEYPAIAVSLVNAGNNHFATAARVVRNLLENPKSLTLAPRTVLNINVPDLPYEELRGIRVTRLGHRAKGGHPLEVTDPRGRRRFWLALAGDGDDAGEGTDFDAVKAGFVSVTPIHADMTRQDAFDSMADWISAVEETSQR